MIEIDRMKRKRGSVQAAAKRGRSPNRFDQFIKNVEQERDYWKNEVDTLQQVLRYVQLNYWYFDRTAGIQVLFM